MGLCLWNQSVGLMGERSLDRNQVELMCECGSRIAGISSEHGLVGAAENGPSDGADKRSHNREQRYGPAERIFCITGLGSRGFFFYSIGFFTCGTVRYAYCIGQDRAVLFVAVRGEPTVAAIVL